MEVESRACFCVRVRARKANSLASSRSGCNRERSGNSFWGEGEPGGELLVFFFLFSISSGERYLVLSLLGSHSFFSSCTLLPCFCHPGLGREEEFGSSGL